MNLEFSVINITLHYPLTPWIPYHKYHITLATSHLAFVDRSTLIGEHGVWLKSFISQVSNFLRTTSNVRLLTDTPLPRFYDAIPAMVMLEGMNARMLVVNYRNVTWASWCFKSLTTHLFVQELVLAINKNSPSSALLVHLWGESTGGVLPLQRTSNAESVSISYHDAIMRPFWPSLLSSAAIDFFSTRWQMTAVLHVAAIYQIAYNRKPSGKWCPKWLNASSSIYLLCRGARLSVTTIIGNCSHETPIFRLNKCYT